MQVLTGKAFYLTGIDHQHATARTVPPATTTTTTTMVIGAPFGGKASFPGTRCVGCLDLGKTINMGLGVGG